MLAIIDLDIGNLSSVANALRRIVSSVEITSAPERAARADILVLPGVGAFERAAVRLRSSGFDSLVRDHAAAGKPLIGICLGMQLLADASEENGVHEGLGLVPGRVVKLDPAPPHYRVPHVGWASVTPARQGLMFPDPSKAAHFYHVHSYHMVCDDPADIAATFEFGNRRIVTAVEKGNIFGMQFHPEKSQDAGFDLLESLVSGGRRP